jgi:glycine cleavage system H protein
VAAGLVTNGSPARNSDAFGAVESVKAASDVYVPATGTVTAINEVSNV